MQTVRICHLYPDLLNLYGDFGNLLAFRHRARLRGIEVSYHKCRVGEALDPTAYDFFFLGGGQDHEQEILQRDLQDKRTALYEAADAGKPFLCICGGYQLMGKAFYPLHGDPIPGVGFLPIVTTGGQERFIGDVVAELTPETCSCFGCASLASPTLPNRGEEDPQGALPETVPPAWLFGFENHSGRTQLESDATPLAHVRRGAGNNGADGTEGCRKKAVIGTYLHGSFLPKNPVATDFLLRAAIRFREHSPDYELLPVEDPWVTYARTCEAHRLQTV